MKVAGMYYRAQAEVIGFADFNKVVLSKVA